MAWLDRQIAAPGPYMVLCTSEGEYIKALRDCGIKHTGEWIKTEHADATCHYVTNASGEAACVICIRPKEKTTAVEIAGLLVHEAVHVWQDYCSRIGEVAPGAEQEAYGIQSIAQKLLAEYATRVATSKRKR